MPAAAKQLWAECLTKALNQIAVHDDLLAWTEFFMLAKVVLRAVETRGGARYKNRAELATKDRCARWLEGGDKRISLWLEAAAEAGGGNGRRGS